MPGRIWQRRSDGDFGNIPRAEAMPFQGASPAKLHHRFAKVGHSDLSG